MTEKRKEDRRVRRSRKLLQNALIQLLRKKPLAKIQVGEIVDLADVSRPTFYYHFETKEQLLTSYVDDIFEQTFEAVFGGIEDGEAVDLYQLLLASFEQWLLHKEVIKWVLQIENRDFLNTHILTHLTKMIEEYGKAVPRANHLPQDDEFALNYLAGGMLMLVKTWIDSDTQKSPAELATLTHMLILNGVFTTLFNHSEDRL
ncbi:MAG: TetR/AcrR family transcriptional regulator [Chloroflexota bacterium]